MWWERRPRFVYFAAILFWAILVSASLGYSFALHDRQVERTALTRARVLFDFVEMVRLWTASHGGVYAEATEATPPNPYLDDPTRDILVDGKLYTKVTPSYMMRQLSDLVRARQSVWFHVTSQRPINPANAADPWEAAVLSRFDSGESEVLERVGPPEDAQYRYMRPLIVLEPCVDCHRAQHYQAGEISGGMSVTMPESQIVAPLAPQRRQAILLHGTAFVLLAGGTLVFLRFAQRNWAALAAARDAQEDLVAQRTAELRAANEALHRSNDELQGFAYVASHDLREPLRMVTSYGSLLERRMADTLDPENRTFLHYMTDGAARMQAMIDDLLDYSRVESAHLHYKNVFLDDAMALVRHDLGVALEERRAQLILEESDVVLTGDPALLHRLLLNLVGNALKYGGRGDTAPVVTVRGWEQEDGMVIEIADNGPGLPAADRDRAFTMFQRLTPPDREAANGTPSGTGMGLAICRRIVERHGGRIWIVPDDPGQGARFRFRLPLRPGCSSDASPSS